MNKSEYIKQLKRLIKKYHPDLNNSNYAESKYNEITKTPISMLNEAKTNGTTNNPAAVKKNTEPDYIFYKLGIKYYRNIHPNQFYERNPDSTYKMKKQDELIKVLDRIYLSFNLSQHYFNRVIKEYPQSPYCEDSGEKIKLLKKIHKSYGNIIFDENKIINSGEFVREMGLKIL